MTRSLVETIWTVNKKKVMFTFSRCLPSLLIGRATWNIVLGGLFVLGISWEEQKNIQIKFVLPCLEIKETVCRSTFTSSRIEMKPSIRRSFFLFRNKELQMRNLTFLPSFLSQLCSLYSGQVPCSQLSPLKIELDWTVHKKIVVDCAHMIKPMYKFNAIPRPGPN